LIKDVGVQASVDEDSERIYTHIERVGADSEKDVQPFQQGFEEKIDVSVIIPVNDQADEQLLPCLNSIILQDHNQCTETIVVAGGNIAQARNMGLDIAQGDYLGFLDSDCIAKPTWIQTLKPCLDDTLKIGGVGCSTISSSEPTNLDEAIDQVYSSFLGSLGSHTLTRVNENRFVNSLSGTGSLFVSHVVKDTGRFDERFEFNEDNELSMRVRDLGSQLLFTPDVEIYHRRPATFNEFAKKFYNYGLGRTRSTLTNTRLFDVRVYALLALFLISLGLILANNYIGYMLATIYLLTIFGVSIQKSVEINRGDLIGVVFALFMVEHLSYAFGLLLGFFSGPWGEPVGEPKVFLHFTVCNRDS
jgi:cellulose synthase/poly-beta-1,6-N-acetylglucosamine synthase-like glycosyltransferase